MLRRDKGVVVRRLEWGGWGIIEHLIHCYGCNHWFLTFTDFKEAVFKCPLCNTRVLLSGDGRWMRFMEIDRLWIEYIVTAVVSGFGPTRIWQIAKYPSFCVTNAMRTRYPYEVNWLDYVISKIWLSKTLRHSWLRESFIILRIQMKRRK